MLVYKGLLTLGRSTKYCKWYLHCLCLPHDPDSCRSATGEHHPGLPSRSCGAESDHSGPLRSPILSCPEVRRLNECRHE